MKKSSKLLGLLLAAGMFVTGCDKSKPVVNPNDDGKTSEQGGEEQQHQHSFGDWKVTKSASCKEAGEKERKCSGCDEVEKEEIPQLTEHSFGDWNETPATCAEDGVKERTCSVCGAKETEDLPKLTTHDFGEWETTKAATCAEAGEKERTCSVCGAVEKEEIAILDTHTFGDYAYNVASGDIKRVCKVCGNEDVIPGPAEPPEQTWTANEQMLLDMIFYGANIPYISFEGGNPLGFDQSAYEGILYGATDDCDADFLAAYAAQFGENWKDKGSMLGTSSQYVYILEGKIETEEGFRYVTVYLYALKQGANGRYSISSDGSGVFALEIADPYYYDFEDTGANYYAQKYGTNIPLPDMEADYYTLYTREAATGLYEVVGHFEPGLVVNKYYEYGDLLVESGYYYLKDDEELGWPIFASEDFEVAVCLFANPTSGIVGIDIMDYPGVPEVNGDELNATSLAIDSAAEGYNSYTLAGASGAEYLAVASADNGFAINGAEGHGIVVTKSAGTVDAVKIIFKEATGADVVVVIYGSNDSFEIADMADEDTAEEKGLVELGMLAVDKDFTTQIVFETEYA